MLIKTMDTICLRDLGNCANILIMNSPFRHADLPMTSQAAEGMARRRWTVAEIEEMVRAGIIDPKERFELIDGEVVPMSPKGAKHEHVKASLNKYWMKRLPVGFEFIPETTLRLDGSSFLEPDFIFFRSGTAIADIGPKNILLAVEVADSSLRYDIGRKAQIYAAYGVEKVWVVEAVALRTHCFAKPSAEGYLERHAVEAHEVLAPDFAPELAVKLAELPLI
jgi:Uma2 family endonuclease